MKHKEPMLRDNAMRGQTIIVTGGGTGLGRSMSAYFLKLGANVVITSRKEDVLKKSAEALMKENGGEVLAVAADVRDYAQVENVLNKAVEKFGTVDGLVNNAAGNFISPTERLSNKAFDVVVDIVLKGSYNCTLAAGKYWIKNNIQGKVLSIVTTYAWTGSAFVVPSACGKAGVLAMTRSLAAEWGKYGIRLNAIAPGPFPTEGAWSRLFPNELEELFDPKNKIPLQRFGDHQELANLAAYLVSDYASFVTGEVITIDGGEWLKGAGEFNVLEKVPGEMWDMLEKITRKGKSS